MKRTIIHVVPGKNGWDIKKEGIRKPIGHGQTKVDTVRDAKEIVKSNKLGQLVIHGKDGKVQTEHTYGKDPFPPKG